MLYRRNEKGRYEAVTDKGQVIGFDDAAEMAAFIEMREDVNRLIGRSEYKYFENVSVEELFPCKKNAPTESYQKKIKMRIYKGEYEVCGSKIKRKALA